MEPKRRILIVDDHPLVRQGLSVLLNREEDIEVVSQAKDHDQAIDALKSHGLDLAIVDLSLRDSSGIDLIREIKAEYPHLAVLVLSWHEEEFYVERALRAGANGYVTKDVHHTEIVKAVRKVLSSGVYVSHRIAGAMLKRVAESPSHASGFIEDLLTSREMEVLEQLGRGMTMAQIARRWDRSTRTVESHCANIKRKLRLDSSRELLQRAIHWVQNSKTATPPLI